MSTTEDRKRARAEENGEEVVSAKERKTENGREVKSFELLYLKVIYHIFRLSQKQPQVVTQRKVSELFSKCIYRVQEVRRIFDMVKSKFPAPE